MPALIDYSGRMEQAREAMLQLVLREGPAPLTMPRVAVEMDVSLSTLKRTITRAEALPRIAVNYVHRELRSQLLTPCRWATQPDDPAWEVPLRRLRWHVPVSAADSEVVRAWGTLTAAFHGALPAAVNCVQDRAELLAFAVREVLDALPDGALSADRRGIAETCLPALVDGLRLAVCEQRLDGVAARAVLDTAVEAVAGL